MEKKKHEWLPHLDHCLPIEAQGWKLSSYAIALEGWRRGLTLKFFNKSRKLSKIKYSLSYNGREHVFAGSRGDLVTKEAIKICINKHLTKKFLIDAGVPTPEGDMFDEKNSDEDIINYANSLGYPVVLKPTDGSGGHGVIANIQNENEFKRALSYVRYDLKYENLIVEKHYDGEGYRVYVIGDKAVGAFDRIPANVIGDGKNNIEILVKKKIRERDKNPALYNRPIIIDQEVHDVLSEQDYTLESIPAKGERVFLKTKNNVSSGGDSIDVTDELTEEIKRIAVEAVKAVPGLVQCGVDLIVDKQRNTAVVLELNARPSIRNHLFPMIGKARDIPKAIIDYYFPETVSSIDFQEPLYYFDVKTIFDAFRSGHVTEVVVPPAPKGELASRVYIVTGTNLEENYENWINRRVTNLNLNGYLKYLRDDKVSIVVSGSADSVKRFGRIIRRRAPKEVRIKNIETKIRKSPVKIGFEILNKKNELAVENKKIIQERDAYKIKYNKVLKSRYWKIGEPLRKIRSLIK